MSFFVRDFKPIESDGTLAAAVVIAFKTSEGQENIFDLDIVYAIPTLSNRIPSPLDGDHKISAVTIENIITDKLSACHRFGSGNTRMKDFDDLWRISKSLAKEIDWRELKNALTSRNIEGRLDLSWINENMTQAWKNLSARNRGLPNDLQILMSEVNSWLKRGLV
jgi:hypothetical protein